MLFSRIALLSVGLLSQLALGTTTQFSNEQRFMFDVDGNFIDAYGSKINYGKYYLYGNSWSIKGSAAYGIKSYSSMDLVNWNYEGFLFDPTTTDACSGSGGCGRPHIIYNTKTKKYILWANSDGYVVATSDNPATGYKFLGSQPTLDPVVAKLNPADFAVELINNEGYIVYSGLNFTDASAGSLWPQISQSLYIGHLTSDLENTTTVAYDVKSEANDLVDNQAESPDLIYRNGIWYVFASNTCGYCSGTLAIVYRSPSIQGPWERQILSGNSCNSQLEGVLPLVNPKTEETTYVWHGTSVPGGPRTGFGGHIFQPLVFNEDGSIEDLKCNPEATFEVEFTLGEGIAASGLASQSIDKSPDLAPYWAVCDSDQYILYQTWTAERTGLLESVSVNIAATTQTTALEVTVFNFSSINALLEPGKALDNILLEVPRELRLLFKFANNEDSSFGR
ncbi:hypothetical protein N7493_001179 [Penicillium malachiteum]|uniref:Uncharacterized protein n=1 Tax=Penicillium malachiteum TaxID=1324776 RepID=A0AAD6HU80_9EURO|nr:hypothetical protein N7493_001179 [Penicillium malachiteum]